jgi:hypothetical protein
MIQESKRLRFELNKLKEMQGVAGNPAFEELDEKTVV